MAFSYYCGADRVPAIDIWVNRIEILESKPVKDVFKSCVIVRNATFRVFLCSICEYGQEWHIHFGSVWSPFARIGKWGNAESWCDDPCF